jgi:hypothetical protein
MLFDAYAALRKLEDGDEIPATSATLRHHEPQTAPVSQMSRVSQRATGGIKETTDEDHFAALQVLRPPESANSDARSYGTSPGGRPLTWTGRVVSLDAWRNLSEWERHGPQGRFWNGKTGKWETR